MNNKFLKIIGVVLINLFVLIGCNDKDIKKEKQMTETNGMLSYTIDGEKTDIKPSKEEGYIVNKIICDNGSDIMWDNDNWEVELTRINGKDRCKVDFTKDVNIQGYRVTVTSNMPNSLDSLSKATTLNGTVKIYSTSKIESITGCNGVIEDNKVIVSNVNSNQTCNINIEDKTLAGIIRRAYPSSGARSSFSSVYTTTALHTATDYSSSGSFNGTTYYFTGNPNNWVEFAGKKWRIIRINGNGSVRLLYAGSGSTDGYIGSAQTYNSSYNHPSYVGWKYTVGGSLDVDRGNSTKSEAYNAVESWYTTNVINAGLSSYIDTDAIYCNDRTIGSENYSTTRPFFYAGYQRFDATKSTPTLECNADDRFPQKDSNGILLDIPAGLMTVDEVIFAGGLMDTNNKNVYYYLDIRKESITGDQGWWTMSPSFFSGGNGFMFVVNGAGGLTRVSVNDNDVVRPVISLKPEILVTGGDGSANSPYEVQMP